MFFLYFWLNIIRAKKFFFEVLYLKADLIYINGKVIVLVSNKKSINFSSRNNPIPHFQVNTDKGMLFVKEITSRDILNENKLKELSKFFANNFINNTNDPSLTQYKNPTNYNKYLKMLDRIKNYYKQMYLDDDGNLTVLEARNSLGDLCAAVVTNTFKDISGLFDNKTCYVDSIAVRKDYRKNHVAKKLMDKAIGCSKEIYTDVFLASDNLAVPFQLKNGFRIMDYNNPPEREVIDRINKFRGDYPAYITFMVKRLDDTSEPWFLRIYNSFIK